jgi:sulfoxide reductase catalytic subunit YedY
LNRRRFLGAGAAAVAALAVPSARAAATPLSAAKTAYNAGGEKITSKSIVEGYNNFYEFGTGKEEPMQNAPKWKLPAEWTIKIDGEVAKPKSLSLDTVMKLAPMEERIYRHRCVERWSIVVPWIGFPLSALLKQVEPTGKAKFVAFESYYDPKAMLSSRSAGIKFPYVEGLRLDEAMHPLALLTFGAYGETLVNQSGAPIRIVVPWKYGYKSIKSIDRISLVEKEPPTTWNISASNEYGFYSNVNPNRDHPRWSQRQEQRLGEGSVLSPKVLNTQLFNGYPEVASLYAGMDLIKNY